MGDAHPARPQAARPGLGPYPEVTLAEARDKALARRREILAGAAPLAPRHKPKGLTFKEAAEALIESKRDGWRNEKHRQQWPNSLRDHVYPALGDRDVKTIDTQDVLGVLRAIWSVKTETAARSASGSSPCWTTLRF